MKGGRRLGVRVWGGQRREENTADCWGLKGKAHAAHREECHNDVLPFYTMNKSHGLSMFPNRKWST